MNEFKDSVGISDGISQTEQELLNSISLDPPVEGDKSGDNITVGEGETPSSEVKVIEPLLKSEIEEPKEVQLGEKSDSGEEVKAIAKEEDKVESIPKKDYDELRSFVDRKINNLTKENRELKQKLEESSTVPNVVESEDYKKLEADKQNLWNENITLAKTLKAVADDFSIDIDEYAPKNEPKPFTPKDIEEILDRKLTALLGQSKKETPVVVQEKKKDNVLVADVLDFMGTKSLLNSNGKANEKGKIFIQELDKLEVKETDPMSVLFTKFSQALAKVSGGNEIDNKVKLGIASAMGGLAVTGSNVSKAPEPQDSLDSLITEMNAFR